jgi:hypothetical protein
VDHRVKDQRVPHKLRLYLVIYLGALLAAVPVTGQIEVVHDPLVVGYIHRGAVFALDLVKQDDGYSTTRLARAGLHNDNRPRVVQLYGFGHAGTRHSFLPWRFIYGRFWSSEGQYGSASDQATCVPEDDLHLYSPLGQAYSAQFQRRLKERYGDMAWHAHELRLNPLDTIIYRMRLNLDDHTGFPRPSACYFDAVPVTDNRLVFVATSKDAKGVSLSVWQGECRGPLEAPASVVAWKEAGKEGKITLHEPFMLFACKRDVVLVTESRKAYVVKVPTDDAPARLEALWLGRSRPIAAIITDSDKGISYAFLEPETGKDRSAYFAFPDTGKRTVYQCPPEPTGINQVLGYARVLLKDGKLNAP